MIITLWDHDLIFQSIFPFKDVADHQKYANNYDYNRSIFLVSNLKFLDNGFVLLQENDALVSPIAVIYYQYYSDQNDLREYLGNEEDNIQCVVASDSAEVPQSVSFGNTQMPDLWDYADGVNTLEFLSN